MTCRRAALNRRAVSTTTVAVVCVFACIMSACEQGRTPEHITTRAIRGKWELASVQRELATLPTPVPRSIGAFVQLGRDQISSSDGCMYFTAKPSLGRNTLTLVDIKGTANNCLSNGETEDFVRTGMSSVLLGDHPATFRMEGSMLVLSNQVFRLTFTRA